MPTATDLVWFVSGDNYVLGEQETPVAVFVYDPVTNEAVLDDDLTLANQIGFLLSGTDAIPYFK